MIRTHGRSLRLPIAGVLATLLLAGLVPAASATTSPIGVFKLLGSTANSKATALTLAIIDPPPDSVSFPTVNVAGTNRLAFRFGEGDALHLSGVPTAAQSTYTIEIWFEFDAVDGYRRIMSFGPNDSDFGLYVDDGLLDLFPAKESQAAVATANQWMKVRVTRSGATKVVKVYFNGVQKIKYTDNANEYRLVGTVLDLEGGMAVFLQDDCSTGCEDGSGTVARIKIWDRVVAP